MFKNVLLGCTLRRVQDINYVMKYSNAKYPLFSISEVKEEIKMELSALLYKR